MRQLTCTGPGKVEWRDVPEPRLEGDGEALVRPLAVARCDIDLLPHLRPLPVREPFALGHECVAEIVALGRRVRGLEIGQRVVVAFQVSCGTLPLLRRGPYRELRRVSGALRLRHAAALGHRVRRHALRPRARARTRRRCSRRCAPALDPVALASVSDNVLDGYRAVAPHLAAQPGADVLIVSHGLKSVPLYAAHAGDRARRRAASTSRATTPRRSRSPTRLGARAIDTDFGSRSAAIRSSSTPASRPKGSRYAIRSTAPEGICQSVSFYAGGDMPMPLGRLYTLGIRFFIGRAHAVALLPEVMPLIAQGRLRPQEVTTRVVDWEDAPEAFLEPAIKLIVRRD